jgi:TatD DNase family protein
VGLIDTHTHLDSFARRGELPAVLQRARAAGLEAMVAIGTDTDDWPLYRELASSSRRKTAGVTGAAGTSGVTTAATDLLVHYSVGLHPCNVGEDWAGRVAQVEGYWGGARSPDALVADKTRPEVAFHPVALGEIGLDRFHLPKEAVAAERILGWQKAAFATQLQLARRLGCPVVIHSREAFRECVEMIDASGVDWSRVVFHCFTEGPAELAELTGRGGFGSFTGVITYKNAETVRAAALAQGLERLMIETDAPYLSPLPHRGKPNEPAYLRHTAEFCAGLFGVSNDRLAEVTTRNAKAFFQI